MRWLRWRERSWEIFIGIWNLVIRLNLILGKIRLISCLFLGISAKIKRKKNERKGGLMVRRRRRRIFYRTERQICWFDEFCLMREFYWNFLRLRIYWNLLFIIFLILPSYLLIYSHLLFSQFQIYLPNISSNQINSQIM